MYAELYQKHYGFPPKSPDESDLTFRSRIAGALRDAGLVVEAHEAQNGAAYDDPERGGDVMTGIFGAMAQALHGVDYHVRGSTQVDTDRAAGEYSRHKKPDLDPTALMLMLEMDSAARGARSQECRRSTDQYLYGHE